MSLQINRFLIQKKVSYRHRTEVFYPDLTFACPRLSTICLGAKLHIIFRFCKPLEIRHVYVVRVYQKLVFDISSFLCCVFYSFLYFVVFMVIYNFHLYFAPIGLLRCIFCGTIFLSRFTGTPSNEFL